MKFTIADIRKNNLEKLIKESGLNKGKFAEKIDTSPAYISQILSIKTQRDMGNDLARKIEQLLGKDRGWMDTSHDDIEPPSQKKTDIDIKLGGFDLWDDDTPLLDDEVALPFLGKSSYQQDQANTKLKKITAENYALQNLL